MSVSIPHRWGDTMMGVLLVGGVAVLIGSLALSPPQPFGKRDSDCQLSGIVTCQGRLVARGTIYLSCIMQPDPYDDEEFPDLTVPIVDGHYAVSGRGGLVPGHYAVTIDAEQLGPCAEPSNATEHRPQPVRVPLRGLVGVPAHSHRLLDFELQR